VYERTAKRERDRSEGGDLLLGVVLSRRGTGKGDRGPSFSFTKPGKENCSRGTLSWGFKITRGSPFMSCLREFHKSRRLKLERNRVTRGYSL